MNGKDCELQIWLHIAPTWKAEIYRLQLLNFNYKDISANIFFFLKRHNLYICLFSEPNRAFSLRERENESAFPKHSRRWDLVFPLRPSLFNDHIELNNSLWFSYTNKFKVLYFLKLNLLF